MTSILIPFLCLAGLIYMITESTRKNLAPLKPDLKKGEVLLQNITNVSERPQSWKYRLALTNRRIIFQNMSWPLVGAKTRYLVLREIESVDVVRRISLLGLILFGWIWLGFAPLGVLLLTILILRPLCHLTVRFHRQGLGPIFARHRFFTGSSPSEYRETVLFAREMQRQKDAIEGEASVTEISSPDLPDGKEDAIFNPTVLAVFGFCILGFMQRYFQDQISVESSIYLAAYCLVPVYMGIHYGTKSGAIVGFMGMMMLFGVAGPNDAMALGNTPEMSRVFLALTLMTMLGYEAGKRRVGSGQYVLPVLVLLWLPIARATDAPIDGSALLFVPVLFAAGVTGLVARAQMSRVAV
jgi:hypothetical protein